MCRKVNVLSGYVVARAVLLVTHMRTQDTQKRMMMGFDIVHDIMSCACRCSGHSVPS